MLDLLDLMNLRSVMSLTSGSPAINVALIDGPVWLDHPSLAGRNIVMLASAFGDSRAEATGSAISHGTFIAGILAANRESSAPGICPECALLVRPVFNDSPTGTLGDLPTASPLEVARAICETTDAGARVINLSATAPLSTTDEPRLNQALDYAANRGVLVVAASGNQGTLASSTITRHRAVIPVVAYDLRQRPMRHSNFGSSVGSRGLGVEVKHVVH